MIDRFLEWMFGNRPPKRPVSFVTLRNEEKEMLVYEVNVAPATDADVVTRRLTILVDGQDGGTIDTPGSTVRFGGLKFDDGAEVEMHLVDIDDAGNQSPPAIHKFTARDTIAPGIPGGFGVRLVGELPSIAAPVQPAAHVTAHSKLDGKDDDGKVGPNTPDAGGTKLGKGDEDKEGPTPGDDEEAEGLEESGRGRKE